MSEETETRGKFSSAPVLIKPPGRVGSCRVLDDVSAFSLRMSGHFLHQAGVDGDYTQEVALSVPECARGFTGAAPVIF